MHIDGRPKLVKRTYFTFDGFLVLQVQPIENTGT